MGLTRDDIDDLIIEVWAPGLELDLYPTDTETGAREFTAVLEAAGAWTGHIVVRATGSFARAVAAKMFGISRNDVGHGDAADAIAELANVVSGNLKSLLHEDTVDLGLPQVGSDHTEGVEVARSIICAAPGFEVTVEILAAA